MMSARSSSGSPLMGGDFFAIMSHRHVPLQILAGFLGDKPACYANLLAANRWGLCGGHDDCDSIGIELEAQNGRNDGGATLV